MGRILAFSTDLLRRVFFARACHTSNTYSEQFGHRRSPQNKKCSIRYLVVDLGAPWRGSATARSDWHVQWVPLLPVDLDGLRKPLTCCTRDTAPWRGRCTVSPGRRHGTDPAAACTVAARPPGARSGRTASRPSRRCTRPSRPSAASGATRSSTGRSETDWRSARDRGTAAAVGYPTPADRAVPAPPTPASPKCPPEVRWRHSRVTSLRPPLCS